MKNKILLVIVIILIPIAVISFFNKKTNFFLLKKNSTMKEQYVILNGQKIPLETYVTGVVSAEMPALFHKEALKAQAVVSRTFAMYQMKHRGYVKDTDQAYINEEQMKTKWDDKYEEYYQLINSLVIETRGELIYYNNELIKSYYFSMSNGTTRDATLVFGESLPYISSINSLEDNDKIIATKKFTKKELLEILNLKNFNNVKIEYDQNKYVTITKFNEQEYSGTEIRKLLGLKSSSFIVEESGDNYTFITSGYGHGVGMSQYGANMMANNGNSYREIINHYYQNVIIK